ncbi:MAG: NTE family protein [Paraglaciecola sp.]|jgi:NTE family protein
MGISSKKKGIGLVLSGGGFRGMAHIGVIKRLEELQIEPTHVSGTSAGALVAAFYAGGYDAAQILEFFKHTKVFNWRNYAFGKAGILEPMKFLPILQEYFPDNTFEALSKKLLIAITNLETGVGEIRQSGELLPSLMASGALPFMFAPVEIDGILYADGGIINNFPVKPLLSHCSKIIGVYVNPLAIKNKLDFKYTYSVMRRAFEIGTANHSMPKFSYCDVMLVPEKLTDHSLVDINHIQDIFEIGYEAAKAQDDELKQLGNW